MIKVINIANKNLKCESCKKTAKYEIQIPLKNSVDVVPLCYDCIDIVIDAIKQIEEAGNDELGKSIKSD